jgi:hypothetical protein
MRRAQLPRPPSYLDLKPKAAEAAAQDGGGSTWTGYAIGIVVAFVGATIVVLLKRRGGGRAVEE